MSIEQWKNKVFMGSCFNSWYYNEPYNECKEKGESFAHACFSIGNNYFIAISSDPISPQKFIDSNKLNSFQLDLSIPAKKVKDSIIYFAKKIEICPPINDEFNPTLKFLPKYKVLELWPSVLGTPPLNVLIGRLAKIEQGNSSLGTFENSETSGVLFITTEDSDFAFYLNNNPERIKYINIYEFLERDIVLNGNNYLGYYHSDYLIKTSKIPNICFSYNVNVEPADIFRNMHIYARKTDSNVTGRPHNWSNLDKYFLDNFFRTINDFVEKEVVGFPDKFVNQLNGFLSIEIVFQMKTSESVIKTFISYGLSAFEIKDFLNKTERILYN